MNQQRVKLHRAGIVEAILAFQRIQSRSAGRDVSWPPLSPRQLPWTQHSGLGNAFDEAIMLDNFKKLNGKVKLNERHGTGDRVLPPPGLSQAEPRELFAAMPSFIFVVGRKNRLRIAPGDASHAYGPPSAL